MKRLPLSLARRSILRAPDWVTGLTICICCLIGVVMIFNASHIDAYLQFGDKFRYARLQGLWWLTGVLAMILITFVPLSWFKKIAPYFLGLVICLLMAVLIPGVGSKYQGARRWLTLGNLVIQPSELAKLALVMYLPALLYRPRSFPLFIIILSLTAGLIILQPDFGTAMIILLLGFGLYFLAGASLKKLIPVGLLGAVIAVILVLTSPYRWSRVQTFFNPNLDPEGTSYHLRQILIALGSGGFTGTGFGRSRQKFQYLPEATTDSIFAVIAEETGFLGAAALSLVFFALFWRMAAVATQLPSHYPQLLAAGVALWFIIQTFINLAAMVSLIPLTGVPLPFISYGGSALFYLNASHYRQH